MRRRVTGVRRLVAIAAGSALVALGACGDGDRAVVASDDGAGRRPVPVVVDTDLSADDVLALLYLARRPDIELRAVLVSGTGLVECPEGADNALRLLALAGRADVPVACGRDRPLAGFNQFPPEWRRHATGFFGLDIPRAARAPETSGAVDVLESVLAAGEDPVTVISLAPLTTLAAALRDDPSIRPRIAAAYVMGGAVGVPGNIGPGHERAEWNLWIDPLAADSVLASGVPVTLVPLDATNDVPITIGITTALRRHRDASREAGLAWKVVVAAGLDQGGQYFWDPLTAMAVTDPDVLRYAPRRVRVVTAGGRDSGRLEPTARGHAIRTAVGADRTAFERRFLATLLGLSRFTVPDPDVGATLTFEDGRCTYDGPVRGPAGQVVFETVNRSGSDFSFVIGRLHDGHTAEDLQAAARRAGGRLEGSPWFTVEGSGATPPRSRMTWVAGIPPGRTAVACTTADPARVWIADVVALTGQR